MGMEKILEELSDHENRLKNLEEYQRKQNGTMLRIEGKVDRLIWAIGAGMVAIILMLVKLLLGGTI